MATSEVIFYESLCIIHQKLLSYDGFVFIFLFFLRKNFGFIAVAWINLFTRNYWYDHIWASWIKLAFSDINSMRNYTLLSLQATLLYATTGWNWQKTKQMLSNTLRLFQNYSHSSFTLSFKNNTTYSKKISKRTRLCIHEIMLLIIPKMKTKMRNSSHRQDINSSRSRHWHKYRKHEKCLSMIKLTCIKQHLSIIWSSIYEKVKQFKLSWKKALLIKKSVCIIWLVT